MKLYKLLPAKVVIKLIENIQKRILEKWKNYFSLKPINHKHFILGEFNFNQRCHDNAIQKVYEGKATKVFCCIVVNEKRHMFIHFINKKGRFYQDNTYGYVQEKFTYYGLFELEKKNYFKVIGIHIRVKKHMFKVVSTRWERLLFTYKNLCL